MTSLSAADDASPLVAGWLLRSHDVGERFEPFAIRHGIDSLDRAYAVQAAFVDLQAETRRTRRAGHKIGLTSPTMQAMCGIDTPVAGVVLADRVHQSGHRLRREDHGRLGIEFEIAVRIGRDMAPSGRPCSLADIEAVVDAVAPAIEIVDDRGCDYATLDVCSLVADNAWNAGIVLGPFIDRWPDLSAVLGTVAVDGQTGRHRGRGSDVLGHPLLPVAWLADHLARRGEPLRAGSVVLTGSMIATQFPERPGHYRFDVGGLGSVELTIEP